MIQTIKKIDHNSTVGLHQLTRAHNTVHTFAVIFARWVFWLLLLCLVGVVIVRHEPIVVREMLSVFVVSLVVGITVNLILGKILVRKRPFETHKLHALISTTWLGGSFPSDHAMFSFVLATPLLIFDPATGFWAMIVALFIAISRVAVGVHYFTDVITGSAVGIVSTYLIHLVI